MMIDNALCIDLNNRHIRVCIPSQLIPHRCAELIAVLSKTRITCSDDLYLLLDSLSDVDDIYAICDRAVNVAVAVMLSNFDGLLDENHREALGVHFKQKGYPMIYDRHSGMWIPAHWCGAPLAWHTCDQLKLH